MIPSLYSVPLFFVKTNQLSPRPAVPESRKAVNPVSEMGSPPCRLKQIARLQSTSEELR